MNTQDPLGFAAALQDFTDAILGAIPVLGVIGLVGLFCIVLVYGVARK